MHCAFIENMNKTDINGVWVGQYVPACQLARCLYLS